MYLSKIELTNYRNYSKLKIKLDPNINIFIGNNAQGKTNILESIYVLALTKSHRYGVENNLIRKDMLACRIKGTVKDGKKVKDLQFVLTNKSEKTVMVNDKEVKKISDYIFNMKVIMFCPDDLEMIKGTPAFRRNFMNIEISQLIQFYVQYLNEYNKILKNRNEYLKLLNVNQYTDLRYLDILNDKLILTYEIDLPRRYKENIIDEIVKNNKYKSNFSGYEKELELRKSLKFLFSKISNTHDLLYLL